MSNTPDTNLSVQRREPATPDPDYLITLRELMSGEPTITGLKNALEYFRSTAPEDHDIVITAYGVVVHEVGFIEPHTLILTGLNDEGHNTVVFAHFSQMVAHVVSRPKRGPERVITKITGRAHSER